MQLKSIVIKDKTFVGNKYFYDAFHEKIALKFLKRRGVKAAKRARFDEKGSAM